MKFELLDSIRSPADVKALDEALLPALCQELREFLVEQVSETGGHLASNLGVVELTVAIHRVFDTSRDRLVFDVGHQCYVHKILTGRRDRFSTLRQFHGLSGFPKPRESIHDAFIAGHASNSVSVALGMARARTLRQQDYNVLAVIGDGAMTGGLAYEGMNNAGSSQEPLIVILNDNGMSISPNVGGLPLHLSALRARHFYYRLKKAYQGLFGKRPHKNPVYRFNHRVKSAAKRLLLPGSSLFEDMGFIYLGPINGHNLSQLCDTMRWAKEQRGPVLIHVMTQKGRGVPFAEKNPDRYHGVGPFDAGTGKPRKPEGQNFSQVFGEALTAYAAEDARVCAITAAMESGTGLSGFHEAYPARFFDVAIAEGHAVSMAAGLASQGMIPVFAVYSTFLQRSYDMLIHDAALQRLHIVLAIDRAGLVGADGETHHGCFDVQFLSGIPGFTVYCPANYAELRSMLWDALFRDTGPVAVRYPRGGEGPFREDTWTGAFSEDTGKCTSQENTGKGASQEDTGKEAPSPSAARPVGRDLVRLRAGNDAALLSYGVQINRALSAADLLAAEGIQAEVWKLNRAAPLDEETVCAALGGKKLLLVLEDAFEQGCAGQRIGAVLASHGTAPERLLLQNLGEQFVPEGTPDQLEKSCGLDAESVAAAVRTALAAEREKTR